MSTPCPKTSAESVMLHKIYFVIYFPEVVLHREVRDGTGRVVFDPPDTGSEWETDASDAVQVGVGARWNNFFVLLFPDF